MPTLLIYGTQDGLFSLEMVEDARALLPEDTIYVAIDGGNHSQFGSYGLQTGDNTATISPLEQWTQTVAVTVEFMKSLSK
jgi:pimeloyl-ACP methyl ester carboxylesterase